MTRGDKTTASKFIVAWALLPCDSGPHGSLWKVVEVIEALGPLIEYRKNRVVEEMIEAALMR